MSADAETLMADGDWLIRRSIEGDDKWASHNGCDDGRGPRRVRAGRCHACGRPAPESVMGFLSMVKWER